ncbi:MAG: hypothetical protein JKY56_19150 [Kofleriaceae bacterium]|nr:hypothetical protein [Kofleriaceae bacterium]
MNRNEFESKVLELWMKSRIPLTQANLQYFAGVPRKKLDEWLDDLLGSGVLDINIEGSESLEYTVPGSERSVDGPTTCEAYERKREMVAEAKRRILARRSGQKPAPVEIEKVSPKKIAKTKRTKTKKAKAPKPEPEVSLEQTDDDDGPGVISMVGKAALFAGGKALVALDKPLAMLDKPVAKGDRTYSPLQGYPSLVRWVGSTLVLFARQFRQRWLMLRLATFFQPSFSLPLCLLALCSRRPSA